MFTRLHKKFSEDKFNFYDYTVGALIGAGAATSSWLPLPIILALMVLSYKGAADDTNR